MCHLSRIPVVSIGFLPSIHTPFFNYCMLVDAKWNRIGAGECGGTTGQCGELHFGPLVALGCGYRWGCNRGVGHPTATKVKVSSMVPIFGKAMVSWRLRVAVTAGWFWWSESLQGGLLYNAVEQRNSDLPCDAVRADVFMPGGVHHKIYSTPGTDGGKASGWTRGWANHLGRKSLCRSERIPLVWGPWIAAFGCPKHFHVASLATWQVWKDTLPNNSYSFEGIYKASLNFVETEQHHGNESARMMGELRDLNDSKGHRFWLCQKLKGHIGHPNTTHRPQGLPKPKYQLHCMIIRQCSRHGTIQQRY